VNLEGRVVGNYAVGALLGKGGMGAVYRATSTAEGPAGAAGSVVAFKVFHAELVADETAFRRFQLEADIGIRIRHENVVRTYELGSEVLDGAPCHFLVMELIEGQTLRDLLKELGTTPQHLLLQIADQALAALDCIHQRGVVHRDIKPENLVVTKEHRLLVMDLGVARLQERGRELTRAGEFVGSVPYASPEQFFEQDSVGPRSDIYSIGVVLYEMATGKNPFDAADLSAILQLKLQGEVARPAAVAPEIDAFLDEVIWTCLAREPSGRFASCAEFRRVLEEGEPGAWWRQRRAGRARPVAEAALKRLRLPREAPLLGRAKEMQGLRDAYARAARGEGCTLLLGGAAGTGKSRLLYQFLEDLASSEGPVIVAGQCTGSGGRSHQPFVEAAHDLLAIEEMDPAGRRAQLEARLLESLPDTPGVVPHLAEFLLGGVQPGMEAAFSKDALSASFVNLLRHEAAARTVILVVEDLHAAGPETLELFAHLGRCLPGHAVLLIVTYREDEVPEGTPLHGMLLEAARDESRRLLAVEPLRPDATEEILRAVARHERTVRALARLLHEKSDGRPLILFEILAHLRSSGLLKEEEDGLVVTGALDELALPSTVRDLTELRLGRLAEEERETLEAAAIEGAQFEATLLATVLEEKRIQLLKRLAILERKHRLLKSSGKDSFRFASRQVHEAVYEGISPSLRTEYHAVYADAIRETIPGEGSPPPPSCYSLVRHLLLAERGEEGEPFVEGTLKHLAGGFHANFSAPFLERLATALAAGDARTLFAIQMKLWGFYEMLGRGKDQLRVIEGAREMARKAGDRAAGGQIQTCLAVSLWRAGEYERAAVEAEAGLGFAREAGDRLWEANALHALGVIYWRKGELQRCAGYWKEALEIRRGTSDRRGVASSLQALAAVMPDVGEGDKALETKLESLAIWREIGDRRGECALLNNVAKSLLDLHRVEEAVEHLQQAVEISRELGDLPSEAIPRRNMGRALVSLGRLDEARASLERALDIFREIGNTNGELEVLTLLGSTLTALGQRRPARAHLERACEISEKTGSKASLVESLRELGTLLHGAGERKEAWERFERGLALACEMGSALLAASLHARMGNAALAEEEFERAARELEACLEEEGKGGGDAAGRLLTLCRLARSLRGAGRAPEAAARAEEARLGLEALGTPPAEDAAEIYFSLANVLEDPGSAKSYLDQARRHVEERAGRIGDDSGREFYLTRTWPNPEILAEARKILGA